MHHYPNSDITFSVVVPLFNKREFIVGTLASVLNQTRKDFEVIIVDDGSTDGSLNVVRDNFSSECIRLFSQSNKGVSAARNFGIKEARGRFVCFLDADDLWLPTKLHEIECLFLSYPKALFAGTSYFEFINVVDSTQDATDVFKLDQCRHELVTDFYSRWAKSPFVFTSSIAVRRATLIGCDLSFPMGESLGEDQDLWFRLCELSPLAFSNKKLVGYRRGLHDNLSGKQPIVMLPAYVRLKGRIESHSIMGGAALQANALLRKHTRDIAIANAREGRRLNAIGYVKPADFLHLKFIITLLMELVSPGIAGRIKRVKHRLLALQHRITACN